MSAPGAAALANHTDVTDVLVVQLRGSKAWRVCGRAQPNVVDGKLDTCATYAGPEMADMVDCDELVLDAGDALFVPRRSVHAARASEHGSAHLTLGFKASADGPCAADRRRRLSCDSYVSRCPANYYSATGYYTGTGCTGCDEYDAPLNRDD